MAVNSLLAKVTLPKTPANWTHLKFQGPGGPAAGNESGTKKAHKHKLFALVNVQMALGRTAGCPRVNRAKKFVFSPRNTGNMKFFFWFTGGLSQVVPTFKKCYVFKVYVPFWKSHIDHIFQKKKPRAHKNKIGTPQKKPNTLPPPPKRSNFMDMAFSCRKNAFFQAPIKLAQPFLAPGLRTRILRTRGFFWVLGGHRL